MRLKASQLAAHLRGPLAPLYGFFSDEPLLLMEAEDALLRAAGQAGYTQRETFALEDGGLEALVSAGSGASLFGERRFLRLRLGQKTPKEGARQIESWCQDPPSDSVLLLTGPRPDGGVQKSAWFRALENRGVTLILYAPNFQEWPRWVEERLRQAGLKASPDAIGLLCERTEGNLLACAQAINRLCLLAGSEAVGAGQVKEVVADSARFSVYDLSDAMLRGEDRTALRILQSLKATGAEPAICLWALHRDLQLLIQLKDRSTNPRALWAQARVFPPRQDWLLQASRRLPGKALLEALEMAGAVDARIKGQDPTPVWPAMTDLVLRLASSAPEGRK